MGLRREKALEERSGRAETRRRKAESIDERHARKEAEGQGGTETLSSLSLRSGCQSASANGLMAPSGRGSSASGP